LPVPRDSYFALPFPCAQFGCFPSVAPFSPSVFLFFLEFFYPSPPTLRCKNCTYTLFSGLSNQSPFSPLCNLLFVPPRLRPFFISFPIFFRYGSFPLQWSGKFRFPPFACVSPVTRSSELSFSLHYPLESLVLSVIPSSSSFYPFFPHPPVRAHSSFRGVFLVTHLQSRPSFCHGCSSPLVLFFQIPGFCIRTSLGGQFLFDSVFSFSSLSSPFVPRLTSLASESSLCPAENAETVPLGYRAVCLHKFPRGFPLRISVSVCLTYSNRRSPSPLRNSRLLVLCLFTQRKFPPVDDPTPSPWILLGSPLHFKL